MKTGLVGFTNLANKQIKLITQPLWWSCPARFSRYYNLFTQFADKNSLKNNNLSKIIYKQAKNHTYKVQLDTA